VELDRQGHSPSEFVSRLSLSIFLGGRRLLSSLPHFLQVPCFAVFHSSSCFIKGSPPVAGGYCRTPSPPRDFLPLNSLLSSLHMLTLHGLPQSCFSSPSPRDPTPPISTLLLNTDVLFPRCAASRYPLSRNHAPGFICNCPWPAL